MARIFKRDATAVYHDTATGENVMNIAGNITTSAAFPLPEFRAFSWDRSGSTVDILSLYSDTVGGTLVATVTFNYTDATKEVQINGYLTII